MATPLSSSSWSNLCPLLPRCGNVLYVSETPGSQPPGCPLSNILHQADLAPAFAVYKAAALVRNFRAFIIDKQGLSACSRVVMQVQRLITVMGARGMRKHALLEDAVLEEASNALSRKEKKVLRAAGWSPGTGLRTLLNFSGASLASCHGRLHSHLAGTGNRHSHYALLSISPIHVWISLKVVSWKYC